MVHNDRDRFVKSEKLIKFAINVMARVRKCVVNGCGKRSDEIPFFSWPKNEEMRLKWRNSLAIPADAHIAPYNTFVCRAHFRESDFGLKNSRLRHGAVPSIQISEDADTRWLNMQNKGKLNVQCSPDTFQKVKSDKEYRENVLTVAAGNNFYEEVIFSQYSDDDNEQTESADSGIVGKCQPTPDSDFVRTFPPTTDSDMADDESSNNYETPSKKNAWLDEPTRLLIAKVKELLPRVGKSVSVKSKRHMWARISEELQKKGYHFTWVQVEAKFFALERRYKKVQLNNSKTGRSRQICPYQDELDDILINRDGINSEYLLSSDSNKSTIDESDGASPSTPDTLDTTPSCSRKRGRTTLDIVYQRIDAESKKQEKRDEELKKLIEENMKQKKIIAEKRLEVEEQKLSLLESLIDVLKK